MSAVVDPQDLLSGPIIGSLDDVLMAEDEEFDLGFIDEELEAAQYQQQQQQTCSSSASITRAIFNTSNHSRRSHQQYNDIDDNDNDNLSLLNEADLFLDIADNSNNNTSNNNTPINISINNEEEEELMNLLDEEEDRIMSVLTSSGNIKADMGKVCHSQQQEEVKQERRQALYLKQEAEHQSQTTTNTEPKPSNTTSSTTSSSSSLPLSPLEQEMKSWGEWDVPLGRAQEVREFIGNVRFRDLVEQYRPAYHATTRKPDKTQISQRIFQTIQSNGGRFLDKKKAGKKKNNETTTTLFEWFEIPQDKALAKISQALRLGTRPVRKYTVAPTVNEMACYYHNQQHGYYYGGPSTMDQMAAQQQQQHAPSCHPGYHNYYHPQQQPPMHEMPSHYASAAPVKLHAPPAPTTPANKPTLSRTR